VVAGVTVVPGAALAVLVSFTHQCGRAMVVDLCADRHRRRLADQHLSEGILGGTGEQIGHGNHCPMLVDVITGITVWASLMADRGGVGDRVAPAWYTGRRRRP
jgi:hypothetical protein